VSGPVFDYGATYRVEVTGVRTCSSPWGTRSSTTTANVFIGTVQGEVVSTPAPTWPRDPVTPLASTLFNGPAGIAVGSGGSVYVLEKDGHRGQRITPATSLVEKFGSGTATTWADGNAR
jgi:hypothetical protein